MTVEDSAKLGAGVALVAYGLHLIVRSFPSAVAVEYRSTTQKTHHCNDRLLSCVNVPIGESKPRQSSETNDNKTKKPSGVSPRFNAVALDGHNKFSKVVIDDGCPVDCNDSWGFRSFIRRIGLWLIAHSGCPVVEKHQSTEGGAA